MTGNRSGRMAAVPEMYATVVRLVPLAETVLSRSHGFQAHALFLKLLKASSPALTEGLHNLDAAKPYTVSPLMAPGRPVRGGIKLKQDVPCTWRLTFLKYEAYAHFLDGVLKWGERPVAVGPVQLRIAGIDAPGGFQSYNGLMESASTERQIQLDFATPTVFRSAGKRNVIFPEPGLVFGSLFSRWQAFSSVKLDDDFSRWFERVLLARYRLKTDMLDFGAYQEVGFTGRCQYEIDKAVPANAAKTVNALADFAFYCGTGAKTTMGMGQTRRWNNARSSGGD